MKEQNNKLSIPAAIILAGVVIAVGIIISNTKPNISATQSTGNTASAKATFKPVDASDHIIGDINAPVVIVEYSDTECPYCKMFQGTMTDVMATSTYSGKIAWVYRHFPVHSLSTHEAEATECAGELGGNDAFWNYTDEVFATTTSSNSLDTAVLPVIAKNLGLDVAKFNTCLSSGKYTSVIQADAQAAQDSGAQGTPFSVIVSKNALSDDKANAIKQFVTKNGLMDPQTQEPYIYVSADKKNVIMGGAMPEQIVTALLDIVLK
jgi:protein-disulfide isomerase